MLTPRTELGILHAELGVLQMAMTDALERASEGEAPEGYAVLLSGYRRVQEAAAVGDEWAQALQGCYEHAMRRFRDRYPGDQPDPSPPTIPTGSSPSAERAALCTTGL